MAKKSEASGRVAPPGRPQERTSQRDVPTTKLKPSALLDTRVIYCGDNLDQLKKLPDACVDLIYIDPPFNSNRNYEIFWPETSEKRRFDDRHESTTAYINYMRPRCEQLARVLKRPAAFIITATGTPATKLESCLM
jgi:DNA methylase